MLALLSVSVTAAAAENEAGIIFVSERENEPIPLRAVWMAGRRLSSGFGVPRQNIRLNLLI
jgi:hypothetical protein